MKNIAIVVLLLGVVLILYNVIINTQIQPAVETKGNNVYQQLQ